MGSSRREADELIEDRAVTINGAIAELGARVGQGDTVEVHGKPIAGSTELLYFLLNKPVGYVCSRRAQGDNPTIYDLLPEDMAALKPVGRLDKDSSGLLLLTNDGDVAFSMTHPKFKKVKVYTVTLDSPLQPLHQQMIADYGVELADGTSKLSLERMNDERTEWVVTMSEGRNRQIRRTFSALGYAVTTLHRTQFGPYRLDALTSGSFVAVTNP